MNLKRIVGGGVEGLFPVLLDERGRQGIPSFTCPERGRNVWSV